MRLEWAAGERGAHLSALTKQLGDFLVLYGGWGLFAISFLDSSFLSFPLINDLLLLHLSSQRPERALIYAFLSTTGSVLGAYAMYGVAGAGGPFLLRKVPKEKLNRAKHWLERNDFVSVLVASLLPPPAPFKVFLIAAGVARVNALRFGAALLVGRGLRFATEVYLGARYGAQAEAYLKENLVWVSLVVVGLLVAFTLVYRRIAKRDRNRPQSPSPDAPSCGP